MIKKYLSLIILSLSYLLANASTTFFVDGIYYLYGIDNTAAVTFDMYGSSKYKGDFVIPEKITHTYYTEFGNETSAIATTKKNVI